MQQISQLGRKRMTSEGAALGNVLSGGFDMALQFFAHGNFLA